MKTTIRTLLNRTPGDIKIVTKKKFPGSRSVGGKFAMNSRTITLYTQEIHDQCFELLGSLKYITDYFKIILAHELGHAYDPLLEELADTLEQCADPLLSAQIALRIEQNAWDYAQILVPEVNRLVFDIIVNRSLEAYHDHIAAVVGGEGMITA